MFFFILFYEDHYFANRWKNRIRQTSLARQRIIKNLNRLNIQFRLNKVEKLLVPFVMDPIKAKAR